MKSNVNHVRLHFLLPSPLSNHFLLIIIIFTTIASASSPPLHTLPYHPPIQKSPYDPFSRTNRTHRVQKKSLSIPSESETTDLNQSELQNPQHQHPTAQVPNRSHEPDARNGRRSIPPTLITLPPTPPPLANPRAASRTPEKAKFEPSAATFRESWAEIFFRAASVSS